MFQGMSDPVQRQRLPCLGSQLALHVALQLVPISAQQQRPPGLRFPLRCASLAQ